jgi:hypothetical protein
MNHLPRLIADWFALWRDLPRHPRQVLLNRAHLPGGTIVILAAALVDLLAAHPYTTAAAYTALVLLGPSSLVAVIGSAVHTLWGRGLIWADLDCEFCGDGDDGDDDDLEPDDPDDGGDLVREITDYLRTTTAATH